MSIILKGIDMPKEGEWLEVIIKPTKEVIADTIRYGDNALLKTEYDSVIQVPKGHGRLKDFDGDGIHPIIVDGVYMVKVDDLDEMPTILESEENDEFNTGRD